MWYIYRIQSKFLPLFDLCSLKAIWDKTLEMRFLLQKGFSTSNKLPQVVASISLGSSQLFPFWCRIVAYLISWILKSSLFSIVLLQEPIRTRFCNHDKQIEQAYDDLLNSSKQTLSSMMELQEVQLVAHIVFISLLWFLNMIEVFLLQIMIEMCLIVLNL